MVKKNYLCYDPRIIVTIIYKDIKDGINILEKIKAKDTNYYEVEKVLFTKKKISVQMGEKNNPYCPMRSTWNSVKIYEQIDMNMKYNTAYSYARTLEE